MRGVGNVVVGFGILWVWVVEFSVSIFYVAMGLVLLGERRRG